MNHIATMPRLTKLALRNQDRGLKILIATALIVGGMLASFIFFMGLSTGL